MELFKNKYGYQPMQENCEGYWDSPLADLPPELQKLVVDDFSLTPWDSLSASQRRSVAAQHDYQQNPDYEPSVYFQLAQLEDDVLGWLKVARELGKDSAIVALRDVADGVREVLNTDRERVGTDIQLLRKIASQTTLSQQGGATVSVERPLTPRERDGLLNIIGGLLELLQDQRTTRADTTNQTKIIEALVAAYSDKGGISQRNLEAKFAEAKRGLDRA